MTEGSRDDKGKSAENMEQGARSVSQIDDIRMLIEDRERKEYGNDG